jgi:hypothetical protein
LAKILGRARSLAPAKPNRKRGNAENCALMIKSGWRDALRKQVREKMKAHRK